MNRTYEIMFIVRPDMEETDLDKLIDCVWMMEKMISDLPRAFRTADLRLIHAAICCSRYSLWTCCGVRY